MTTASLPPATAVPAATRLRAGALHALAATDPSAKVQATRALLDCVEVGTDDLLPVTQPLPGRPAQPVLVAPGRVKSRSVHTVPGRAALLHALAHIEFNAINLALDAIWRFPGLPEDFYRDWLTVAVEESLHFEMLQQHLVTLGCTYGDLPAHNGLWEMAEKTQGDLLARMALVPRTLEARGLDAALPMRDKLAAVGDLAAAAILDRILTDEIGHVAIGNRWYRWVCTQRGLDPVPTYDVLAQQYAAPRLKGPFNLPARRAAGFLDIELEALEAAWMSDKSN